MKTKAATEARMRTVDQRIAKRLRDSAQQTSSTGAAQLGFAIAEQTHGEFGYQELLDKEFMRRPA